jgi:hypothetical protein
MISLSSPTLTEELQTNGSSGDTSRSNSVGDASPPEEDYYENGAGSEFEPYEPEVEPEPEPEPESEPEYSALIIEADLERFKRGEM